MRPFLRTIFLLCCFIPTSVLSAAITCTDTFCSSPQDIIPRFDMPATIATVRSGDWADPGVWNTGKLPGPTDRVSIRHALTYGLSSNTVGVIGIDNGGSITVKPAQVASLTVTAFLVLPGGQLQRADGPGSFTLTIADSPIATTSDPFQYGHGVLVLDGILNLQGASKTAWGRLGVTMQAGVRTLTLESAPMGWLPGDRLFLPDTRHLTDGQATNTFPQVWLQEEEVMIASISGAVVTLAAPTQFPHLGAVDAAGTLTFRPAIANMTRSGVTIQSANPQGVRGHLFVTGRSNITLRNVLIRDMGRATVAPLDNTIVSATILPHIGLNQQGRYALHLHHLYGPELPVGPYQFLIEGNVIRDSQKWALTVHDTHYGHIADNVLVGATGAGIMTEEGNETGNVIEHNFVANISGYSGRQDNRKNLNPPEYGWEGAGFWFAGMNNIVRDNVAVNIAPGYAYTLFGSLGQSPVAIPNNQGNDTVTPGQYTLINLLNRPAAGFSGNEAGASYNGVILWTLNADCCTTAFFTAPSIFPDMRLWHIQKFGVYNYGSHNLTFDHWVFRNDPARIHAPEGGTGFWYGPDYIARKITISHADIQNMGLGIGGPSKAGDIRDMYGNSATPFNVTDSVLINRQNYWQQTPWANTGGGSALAPRLVTLRNVLMQKPPTVSVSEYKAISLSYRVTDPGQNVIASDVLQVFSHNGVQGADFQVYQGQQFAGWIVPTSGGSNHLVGAPVANLTNAQALAQYGVAIGGEIAPCLDMTTHPEIGGFTCPIVTLPQITQQPASVTIALSCQVATFTVQANGNVTGYQWQRNGANIPGATSSSYTTPCVAGADNSAQYRCLVTNAQGATTSLPATLAVTGP